MKLHWNVDNKRTRGLGENLSHVYGKSMFVSNLEQSLQFYEEILGLQIIERSDTSAKVDAKNMIFELRVGTPITFSGENLIVSHISIDVMNVQNAFDHLHFLNVSADFTLSWYIRCVCIFYWIIASIDEV